jgi:hypothetical protein
MAQHVPTVTTEQTAIYEYVSQNVDYDVVEGANFLFSVKM